MRLYRPSNGEEGEFFQAGFCYNCAKQRHCTIIEKSMIYDVEDAEYPKELVRVEGKPKCLKFRHKNAPVQRRVKRNDDLPLFK
jgi:hypothetical protein